MAGWYLLHKGLEGSMHAHGCEHGAASGMGTTALACLLRPCAGTSKRDIAAWCMWVDKSTNLCEAQWVDGQEALSFPADGPQTAGVYAVYGLMRSATPMEGDKFKFPTGKKLQSLGRDIKWNVVPRDVMLGAPCLHVDEAPAIC